MHLVRRLIPATVMLVMSFGGIIAQYQPQMAVAQTQTPPRPGTSGMNFENKLLQQLNLTPEQTQKIQVIQDKYRTEREQSMPVLREVSKEFRTLMDGDTPTAQLRDKYRQMLELQQKISSLSFEHQLAIRDVLTSEQRRQQAAILRDPNKVRALFQPSAPNRPSAPNQPSSPNPKLQKHLLK